MVSYTKSVSCISETRKIGIFTIIFWKVFSLISEKAERKLKGLTMLVYIMNLTLYF